MCNLKHKGGLDYIFNLFKNILFCIMLYLTVSLCFCAVFKAMWLYIN